MFVEHQSTSDTKIHSPNACARGVLLDFPSAVFTGWIVF